MSGPIGKDTSGSRHAKASELIRLRGVGAAIANAIYNATGVREYPITLDKLIDRLPDRSDERWRVDTRR